MHEVINDSDPIFAAVFRLCPPSSAIPHQEIAHRRQMTELCANSTSQLSTLLKWNTGVNRGQQLGRSRPAGKLRPG